MAGVGVRYLEMARFLGRHHQVTLLAPNQDLPDEEGIRLGTWSEGAFVRLTRDAEAVVVHGHVSNQYFSETRGIPTVVDLYDPFLVENLHYAAALGPEVFLHDHATLRRQLRRGDFFLCFTPWQRLFYLGMLAALGRVNPDNFLADRPLDSLMALVPFGVPAGQPVRGEPMLRGRVEGIGEKDRLLFYGGIYDWHDPLTALRAMEIFGERDAAGQDVKLIFVRNPNLETTPQQQYNEAHRWCEERGWIGRRVIFIDWIDYERRESAYLECDLGLATFPAGLEADLSFRTRVLDWLWCGLPALVTDGGWTGELLRGEGAGAVVEPGNPEALAREMGGLLGDRERCERLARCGQALVAQHFRWETILEPLDRFCRAPRIAPDKGMAARADDVGASPQQVRGAGRRLRDWLTGGSR
jgi:glycosyltransferase involved in cell wall biosynthesis